MGGWLWGAAASLRNVQPAHERDRARRDPHAVDMWAQCGGGHEAVQLMSRRPDECKGWLPGSHIKTQDGCQKRTCQGMGAVSQGQCLDLPVVNTPKPVRVPAIPALAPKVMVGSPCNASNSGDPTTVIPRLAMLSPCTQRNSSAVSARCGRCVGRYGAPNQPCHCSVFLL